MPSSCCVSDCENKYSHTEDVSYHKFPFNKPEILFEWIRFTRRDEQWKPSKWSAICSRHFVTTDFKDCAYRKYLNGTSIPSIRSSTNRFNCDKVERLDPLDLEYHEESISSSHNDDIFESTCRLCANVNRILTDYYQHINLIIKCLSFINLESNQHLPTKICRICVKNLTTYSEFIDKIAKAQADLEIKFSRNSDNEISNQNFPESSRVLKIKQEPLTMIKEEKLDYSIKPRENNWSEINEGSIFVRKPNIINDKNQILLFNNTNNDNQSSKLNRESKTCEILEIVNLYPPIVDITSATIRELQPYCADLIMPTESSLETMKIENTTDDLDDYIYPYEDSHLISLIEDEHCYCKLPILDDNKEEITVQTEVPISVPTPVKRISIKKSHKCKPCGHYYPTKQSLSNHQKYICSVKSFKCQYCVKKFKKFTILYAHQKVCPKRKIAKPMLRRVKKEIIEAPLVAALKLKEEKRIKVKFKQQEDGLYYCELCERSYGRAGSLRMHLSRHRPKEEWSHKCGRCCKLFDKLFDLKRHIQKQQCNGNDKLNESQSNTIISTAVHSNTNSNLIWFVCSTCGKQLTSYNSLKVHESIHTGLKTYICETCGKSFSGQTNLCQHRLTHLDVRKYKCHLCDKIFKRSGGLLQHVKSIHLKIKPYTCETCRRPYALKYDMLRCKHSLLKN